MSLLPMVEKDIDHLPLKDAEMCPIIHQKLKTHFFFLKTNKLILISRNYYYSDI
jgi:hypothetical protein